MSKLLHFLFQSIMVLVSFIDCGNYVSNTTAGARFQYALLFVILISNLVAILFQCLCVKLGCVTGLDLAQMCRKHFPRKLNLALYVCAELAIVATDLAGVVGTAIALNILFGILLQAGVLITVLDVLAILVFYKPEKSLTRVKAFEFFVLVLVGATVLCFTAELFSIDITDKAALIRGVFPSKTLLDNEAIYASCALVGATVMPHLLYLGLALVQPRMKHYDKVPPTETIYTPLMKAIKYCLNISYFELIVSLFFVSTFVNGAMLVVAGTALYGTPEAQDADMQSIYTLLEQYVLKLAATVFVVLLLFLGQASGLVVTISGQVVLEGFIQWTIAPWVRRLVTRLILIVPCLLVTYSAGSKGINDILNASQVFLLLVLPFCLAPLIYFTCSKTHMAAPVSEESHLLGSLHYANTSGIKWLLIGAWVVVGLLNLANIVFISKGLV